MKKKTIGISMLVVLITGILVGASIISKWWVGPTAGLGAGLIVVYVNYSIKLIVEG